MFNFDNKGFLKPYKIIKCTENQFRDFFIYSLSNVKFIREKRWNEYCEFISFIKRHQLRKEFKVWIYGSLVGNYKEPSDVDIVLFFDKNDFINICTANVKDYIEMNASDVFNVHCARVFKIPENRNEVLVLNDFKLARITINRTKGAIEIIY